MPLSKILSASLGTGVGGKVLQVVTATDSTARTTTSTSFVTASNTLSLNNYFSKCRLFKKKTANIVKFILM